MIKILASNFYLRNTSSTSSTNVGPNPLLSDKGSPHKKAGLLLADTPQQASASSITRFTKSFAPVKWLADNWKPLLAVLLGITLVAAGVLSGGTAVPLSLDFLVAASAMVPSTIGALSGFAAISYGCGSM